MAIVNEQSLDFLPDFTPFYIAERFGWTLDYIDSLGLDKLEELAEYDMSIDGMKKGYAWIAKRDAKLRGVKG